MKTGAAFLLLITVLIIAGCEPVESVPPAEEAPIEEAPATDLPATAAPEPAEEPADTVVSETLPPDPQEILIPTADGVDLAATYWPAATSPAPVIVLMHQINMDGGAWAAIGPWLQNRGLAEGLTGDEPFLDPSWFPQLPADFSVGVIAITFRGCEGGCSGFDPEGWEEDARAAVAYAASLPESTGEVFTMGTSIGADGAVNGCALTEGACVGAMPLSPGSFLAREFAADAALLTEAGVPVKCFTTEGDTPSAFTCGSFSGDLYEAVVYEGDAHGIYMIMPEMDVLTRLVGFLEELFIS